jgi:hypothetical protein
MLPNGEKMIKIWIIGHSDNAFGDNTLFGFYNRNAAENKIKALAGEYWGDAVCEWRDNQREFIYEPIDKDCPECLYLREVELF